jgi:glucose/arabinose dehydrogenase
MRVGRTLGMHRRGIAGLALATAVVAATVGSALLSNGARAASSALPRGFHTRLVIGRLGEGGGGLANAFAFAPGGRTFVARKTGVVDVYDHGVRHVFLDLSHEVDSAQGRGMLGLAVDPHFASNGRVYLMFTSVAPRPGRPGGKIISIRGRGDDPDRAALPTRVNLLTGYVSSAPQHADGALRFDRDGNLLAGWGDGTPDKVSRTGLFAQSLDDLRGKIIRINPRTGAGVPGNPWYSAAHPNRVRSKVYIYGLRNPYRFSVDQQNGTVYVGDVGWTRFDELDAFRAKATNALRERNGGWPCYEGSNGRPTPQPSYQTERSTAAACRKVYPPGALGGTGAGANAPLWAYPHVATACIIGGPKYTGRANYPRKYDGLLFVADWARDTFHTVNPTTGAATLFGSGWGSPLDIQLAPDGNVAYLAQTAQSLREIVYTG